MSEEEEIVSETHSVVSTTQSEDSVATIMATQQRINKDYLAPNLEEQPLRITFSTHEGGGSDFNLKYGFIHKFSTFHGRSREDPNKHATEGCY